MCSHKLIVYPIDLKFNRRTDKLCITALESIDVPNGETRYKNDTSVEKRNALSIIAQKQIELPWNPCIYIYCNTVWIKQVKYLCSIALVCSRIKKRTNFITVRRVLSKINVSTLSYDELFWNDLNFSMFELKFNTFREAKVCQEFLKTNADIFSKYYALPTINDDNDVFNVALRVALSSSTDLEICKSGLQINKYFQLCNWYTLDYSLDYYFVKLKHSEMMINDLPVNPLKNIPVLAYDIETVSKNKHTLSKGITADQRIVSFAVSIYCAHLRIPCISYQLIYIPPAKQPEESQQRQKFIVECTRFFAKLKIRVIVFDSEQEMLAYFLDVLINNKLLLELYRIEPEYHNKYRNASNFLIGYNQDGYDFPVIANRLVFFNMFCEYTIMCHYSKRRTFNPNQINVDLMRVDMTKYKISNVSRSLNEITRKLNLNESNELQDLDMSSMNSLQQELVRVLMDNNRKMAFNSINIRWLYYDEATGNERFNYKAAFDETNPAGLYSLIAYNVQDCQVLHPLFEHMLVLDSIVFYSQFFFVDYEKALTGGNSVLIPGALQAICYRAMHIIAWRDNALTNCCCIRQSEAQQQQQQQRQREHNSGHGKKRKFEIDGSNINRTGTCLYARLGNVAINNLIYNENEIMRVDDKAYIGGINNAISGHYKFPFEIDFSGFYPNIGCHYNLSVENVRVTTVGCLKQIFGRNLKHLCKPLKLGLISIFDYEPPESNSQEPNDNVIREKFQTQRRSLAENLAISNEQYWYEGVEFLNVQELLETSANDGRRVLCIINRPEKAVILVNFWKECIKLRKEQKRLLQEAKLNKDKCQISMRECLQLMYKIVANSLYGYLNYVNSKLYSPSTAAAVTLLARKTFCETRSIISTEIPRWLKSVDDCSNSNYKATTVYEDTDGLIFVVFRNGQQFTRTESLTKTILDLINDSLPFARNCGKKAKQRERFLRLEQKNVNATSVCVMGKKKLWGSMSNNEHFTIGFERNAPKIFKELVSYLEHFVSVLHQKIPFGSYRLYVLNVHAFYWILFDQIHAKFAQYGIDEFTQRVKLNPKNNQGFLAEFIQRSLLDCAYDVGDRIICYAKLEKETPIELKLVPHELNSTTSNQSSSTSSKVIVNYYHFFRRTAIYLLQIVEGVKRNDLPFNDRRYMNSTTFDKMFKTAWYNWYNFTENNVQIPEVIRSEIDAFRELLKNPHDTRIYCKNGHKLIVTKKNALMVIIDF